MTELNRREFAEALAFAAVAPMLGVGAGSLRWNPTVVASLADAAGAAGYDPGSLAQALSGAIRAQFGERLSEADLATVTRQIQASLERAEKIRKTPLANGDEPDLVFSALRDDLTG
ncbi:MAG TPA: hypothetical protein VH680_17110 [Gemmatimonadales bacterium]|jgi:hypothetical protein